MDRKAAEKMWGIESRGRRAAKSRDQELKQWLLRWSLCILDTRYTMHHYSRSTANNYLSFSSSRISGVIVSRCFIRFVSKILITRILLAKYRNNNRIEYLQHIKKGILLKHLKCLLVCFMGAAKVLKQRGLCSFAGNLFGLIPWTPLCVKQKWH